MWINALQLNVKRTWRANLCDFKFVVYEKAGFYVTVVYEGRIENNEKNYNKFWQAKKMDHKPIVIEKTS